MTFRKQICDQLKFYCFYNQFTTLSKWKSKIILSVTRLNNIYNHHVTTRWGGIKGERKERGGKRQKGDEEYFGLHLINK